MNEKRKRIEPRAPVEVKVEYQHLNALVSDYTKNLSRGGMFVPSDQPPEIGSHIFVTLVIPDIEDPLVLEATVRHHQVLDDVAGFGAEFIYTSDEEKKALEAILDNVIFNHLGERLYNSLKSIGTAT